MSATADRRIPAVACASLLADLAGTPMAIHAPAGEQLFRLLTEGARSGISAAAGGKKQAPKAAAVVAGVGLYGVLFPRENILTEYGYGTALSTFAALVSEAATDPAYDSLIIHIDSPGGSVYGTEQAALAVRAAAKAKPVVAVVDSLAASAAYWIASQAGEVVVAPEGEVGSVGVYIAHADYSRALDAEGIKVTYIKAGEKKTDGNPYEPLGDRARQTIQAGVDDYYQMFLAAVARGRGVSASTVASDFGQGATVRAKQAVASGMADRIGTLRSEVSSMMSGTASARASRTTPRPLASRTARDPETARRWRELEAEEDREHARLDGETARWRKMMDEDRPGRAGATTSTVAVAPPKPAARPAAHPPLTTSAVLIAWHEAGHAVAAVVLGSPGVGASIVPDATSSGRAPFSESGLLPWQIAAVCYAGAEAQKLCPLADRYSISLPSVPDCEIAARCPAELRSFAEHKARQLVAEHREAVARVAGLLCERRELDDAEIRAAVLR